MDLRSRYSIIIEDDARLERKLKLSIPLYGWILAAAGIIVFLLALGALILYLSPARTVLPGYLKSSERAATEEKFLRLDSMQKVMADNERYINNIKNVFNPVATPRDTTTLPPSSGRDSLLSASPEERKFVASLREKEKYNISVIAPLAAESMMFNPVNDEAVVTHATRNAPRAEVVLASGATVAAIADGKVISVSQSIREGGGSAVIIQHPKGFLSRLTRLGTVLVEPGDDVFGGQVIATQNTGNGRRNEIIGIEMWHNGNPLVPYRYLGDSVAEP